jgi:hypothetical protein
MVSVHVPHLTNEHNGAPLGNSGAVAREGESPRVASNAVRSGVSVETIYVNILFARAYHFFVFYQGVVTSNSIQCNQTTCRMEGKEM